MAIKTGTAARDTLGGTNASDTLTGLAGNDLLTGGDNADFLYGDDQQVYEARPGDGNDRMFGEAGNDFIVGGGHRVRRVAAVARSERSFKGRAGTTSPK